MCNYLPRQLGSVAVRWQPAPKEHYRRCVPLHQIQTPSRWIGLAASRSIPARPVEPQTSASTMSWSPFLAFLIRSCAASSKARNHAVLTTGRSTPLSFMAWSLPIRQNLTKVIPLRGIFS